MVAVVAFVAIQAGTNVAIRNEWVSVRDPLYIEKFALLRGHPAFAPSPAGPAADRPTTVLFVGSSRTLNGVDAAALEAPLSAAAGRPVRAFNFGLAGCGPVTNALYVRRLRRDGAAPDFVVIEVHPAFLAGQLASPPETQWLLPARLRPDEFAVANALGFPADPPRAHGPEAWAAAWYHYRLLMVDRWFPFMLTAGRLNAGHESNDSGFTRLQDDVTPAEQAYFLARTAKQYQPFLDGYRVGGPGPAAVRDMLDQCRRAGWKAALFLSPESTEFRGWYPPAGRAEFDRFMRDTAAEFAVPLFDATGWLPDSQIMDGHHLTGRGADALTARLAREALGPWLAADPRPGDIP